MKKKAIYLHGLDAVPNLEKIAVLEKNYEYKVIAPKLDYYASIDSLNLFDKLIDLIKDYDVQTIFGSSFGGYMGFYLSEFFNIDAYLFNPALKVSTIHVPVRKANTGSDKSIIIGKYDRVVFPENTKSFLEDSDYTNYKIIEEDFAHQFSPIEFEKALEKLLIRRIKA